MTYLLDTNVISELRKRTGSTAVKAWASKRHPDDLFISVVTVIEIETGILRHARRDRAQADTLQRWLEDVVLTSFTGRILPIDVPVARQVASLHVPNRAPEHDALIAGTALAHDLIVVTRNTRDFLHSGVRLVDPWGS